MNNCIVYLQLDLRYDHYALKTIAGVPVLNHTLDKIAQLKNIEKIIVNLYDCADNREIDLKQNNKIKLQFSAEENLTTRMLNSLRDYGDDYVLIISSDQIFLDVQKVNEIYTDLVHRSLKGYYSNFIDGRLCNIFKVSFLKNLREKLNIYDRYYKYITVNKDLFYDDVVFESIQNKPPFRYYIRNNMDYLFSKKIYMTTANEEVKLVQDYNRRIDHILDSIYYVQNDWVNSIYHCASIENLPVLPWITYSAIDFIKSKINPDLTVFEYGSGLSTCWWAQRVKKIVSIEHDLDWYNRTKVLIAEFSNTGLKHIPLNGPDYCNEITKYNHVFDIIVVDGRKRVMCGKNCLKALKDNGVIIWDDTDRARYKEGVDYLIKNGFKQIGFSGTKSGVAQNSQTSVFYREKNVFGI